MAMGSEGTPLATDETDSMSNLHDTQPSRRLYLKSRHQGVSAPPRILFWGVIIVTLIVLLGIAGVVIGFREVLKPAQQQRVIDQLPFMAMLRRPTPQGGVFPTLVPQADVDDALALLDMPLDFATPLGAEVEISAASPRTAVPTNTPTPAATPEPTATDAIQSAPPTPRPSGDALPATAVAPALNAPPPAARISGIVHQQQTWNNCGPATITMALSYYGWQQNQAFARVRLKPNREDKNVGPHELARFVEDESFVKAIVRMGGTLDLLKRLVANGFPVVIETGEMFEAYDWIGHYRVLIAYDDSYQTMYFFDSFLGVGAGAQGIAKSYDQVDRNWQAFNRTFIVVYEPQREELLRNLLGAHWDESSAAQLAFETARAEARREPQNPFAWFNMGTSLVDLGRYQEAAAAYDQANRTGKLPWRMYWYQFGAFEAYYEQGRYDDVLSLARINQNNSRELEETYYWQGRVHEAQGRIQQAASSYRRALTYNPNYADARAALDNLS